MMVLFVTRLANSLENYAFANYLELFPNAFRDF
jgi:hypothetical protein